MSIGRSAMNTLETLLIALSLLAVASNTAALEQDDIDSMFDKAIDAVEAANDGPLDSSEKRKVGKNFKREFKNRVDGDEWDRKASHFEESVDDYGYDYDEFVDHVRGCPICNPLVRKLVSGTGIRPVPYRRGRGGGDGLANYCHTNYGSCALSARGMPGGVCYCVTPYGTIPGIASQ